MYFDLDILDEKDRYKLLASTIVPRPVAWVVSKNSAGTLNAAPFSFFNILSNSPPVLAIGIGPRGGAFKDTTKNIAEIGEFVVNVVPHRLLHAMNITAVDFDSDIDEISAAALTTIESTKIAVPRIAESPVAFECKIRQTIELGNLRSIVLGDIVAVHIDDGAMLDIDRFYVDTPRLDLVGRMHGSGWFVRTNELFEAARLASHSDGG